MRLSARLTALLVVLLAASSLFALERGKDGFYETGEGVRTKKVAFFHVKVYQIESFAKELPAVKSKAAMITLDTDKKLEWKMLRSVGAQKIKDAMREAYEMNGYSDQAKIDSIKAPFVGEVKDGATVTISYDAATKTTSLATGGRRASVPGEDFMRATWSIWFGHIDQPSLQDALISKLK